MDTENNQVCVTKKNIDDIEERIKNAMITLQEVINNKEKIEKEKNDAIIKLEEVINAIAYNEVSLKDFFERGFKKQIQKETIGGQITLKQTLGFLI